MIQAILLIAIDISSLTKLLAPMIRETNRYAEQRLQIQELIRRSKALQWKPTEY